MSIHVSEKLKLMRESERLNRREVSDLTGVPYSSLSSYESRSKNAGVDNENSPAPSFHEIHDVVYD